MIDPFDRDSSRVIDDSDPRVDAALRQAGWEIARIVHRSDRRSRGARKGWEKRREREARERFLDGIDIGPVRTGPVCDEMSHDSTGREVFCQLDPGHGRDEDHDDDNGTTWPCED